MASANARKSIFTLEERKLIRPFQAAYLAAKTPLDRKTLAMSEILPPILAKWRNELGPGETLNTEEASKVSNKDYIVQKICFLAR